MRKSILALALSAAAISLAACGDIVQVPPGYVGRVVSSSGMDPTNHPPGGFRLGTCAFTACPYLVLLEATDQAVEESMEIILSSGNQGQAQQLITIQLDVRLTIRVNDDNREAINIIFDRISPRPTSRENPYARIDLEDAYNVFGRNTVRTVVRNMLGQANLNQFLVNRGEVETRIYDALKAQFRGSPVELVQFGFGNVTLPAAVREAQETAERRRIEIQNAESQRQIAQINAARELEMAQRDREIRLLRASTERDVNSRIAASVTPEWITYRYFEVLDSIGRNPSTIFFPIEMLTDEQLRNNLANGLGTRVFNTQPQHPQDQPEERTNQ